jgi:cytochrome c
MKRSIILIGVFLTVGLSNFYAVSQTKKQAPKPKSAATTTSKNKGVNNGVLQGKDLLAKSDCLSCHQEQTKVVGPSYKSVAEKYAGTETNITMLTNKIIAGGTGVWGQIPMPPHPTLSKADATKMVKYILSLSGK